MALSMSMFASSADYWKAQAEADAKDAARYRAFRELVKSDPVRAQALVWEAKPSRTRFDALVDASRE